MHPTGRLRRWDAGDSPTKGRSADRPSHPRSLTILILNDIHAGVVRKGGTTPASQEALRAYLFRSLRAFLRTSTETHLLILGDLFDDFEVAPRDWLEVYDILSEWLFGGERRLTLVAGNHDHSPKASRVSSFGMLCEVLRSQFCGQVGYDPQVHVVGIDQIASVAPGVHAAAHCSNQDVFNDRLGKVLNVARDGDFVLLHANFDNNFAAQSDHSLNVAQDAAKMFIDKGINLVFAHEHQARREMPHGAKQTGAEVIVLGNQWPTSIADCLGNDTKYAHALDGELLVAKTWSASDPDNGFHRVNWRELGDLDLSGFVRVEGEATAAESAEVINAIAKFRQRSPAFVIANAVAVDGVVAADELPASFEAAKKFDVLEFIRGELEPGEMAVVEELMKEAA